VKKAKIKNCASNGNAVYLVQDRELRTCTVPKGGNRKGPRMFTFCFLRKKVPNQKQKLVDAYLPIFQLRPRQARCPSTEGGRNFEVGEKTSTGPVNYPERSPNEEKMFRDNAD